MEQWLIAALVLVGVVAVVVIYEVLRAERESRKAVIIEVDDAPETIEKRARRAF